MQKGLTSNGIEIEVSMGYSTEEVLYICQKKYEKETEDDIGQDAMVLASKKREEKMNELMIMIFSVTSNIMTIELGLYTDLVSVPCFVF